MIHDVHNYPDVLNGMVNVSFLFLNPGSTIFYCSHFIGLVDGEKTGRDVDEVSH